MNRIKRAFSDVSVRCAAFLMAYYMTNSVFQGFMSLYYEDIGLNDAQIGTINALIAVISVPAMALWGHAGDRAKVRNRLLAVMCLCSSALILLVKLNDSFAWVIVSACAFASFYTSIQPMGDSVALTSLDDAGRRFGPVRMAGGLSFAVMSPIFNYIQRALGSESVIYSIAIMCVIIALSAMYMPRVGKAETNRSDGSMFKLFKDRELLMLFCFMVPLQITYGYFYAFFSPLLRDDLAGGAYVGWAYFISAASEVPFLLNSDKWFKKYGAGKLMCVSALFMTARWLIVAMTHSPIVAMISQLLHSMGFITITVSVSKYVQATVGEHQKAKGQLLISVFGFGVARAAGYFGGGLLSDQIGRQAVFYVCAGICLICLMIFAPYYFRRRALNGEI